MARRKPSLRWERWQRSGDFVWRSVGCRFTITRKPGPMFNMWRYDIVDANRAETSRVRKDSLERAKEFCQHRVDSEP